MAAMPLALRTQAPLGDSRAARWLLGPAGKVGGTRGGSCPCRGPPCAWQAVCFGLESRPMTTAARLKGTAASTIIGTASTTAARTCPGGNRRTRLQLRRRQKTPAGFAGSSRQTSQVGRVAGRGPATRTQSRLRTVGSPPQKKGAL